MTGVMITLCLVTGNKECPTCRKKLVSKRSLRPDPNFDQLVSKIYPDKEECDEEQEKAKLVHAKRLCKKRHLAEEVNEVSCAAAEGGQCRVRLSAHSEMKDSLKSRLKQRERRLETVSSAQVAHLVEYVRVRLGIELGLENKVGKENTDKNVQKGELKNINIYKQDPSSGVLVKLDKDQTLSSLLEEKGEEDLLELLFNCDLQTGKPC